MMTPELKLEIMTMLKEAWKALADDREAREVLEELLTSLDDLISE